VVVLAKNVEDKLHIMTGKLATCLIAAAWMIFMGCTEAGDARLTVVVEAQTEIPAGNTLFVAGNLEPTGSWRPDGVALSTDDSTTWRTEITLPRGSELEFKITRGTWQSEAVNRDGSTPGNHAARIERDTTLYVSVFGWKDISGISSGQITGEVEYLTGLEGEGIPSRDAVVLLPDGYAADVERRYPVLYVHDGQNVFDPVTSYTGVDWQIDEHVDSLSRAGRMEEIIVVGIYNTPARRQEYDDTEAGRAYLDFIVRTLKPRIDSTYRTRPEAEYTAVMGSSMGGTISFLALWYHPDVFSKAACLSPYFPPDLPEKVAEREWDTASLSLYLDNGDDELDTQLQESVEEMLPMLRRAGFAEGRNLMWHRAYAAEHSEQAWATRVWRPLLFFFGNTAEDFSR
jgi:enterochelin esterase-like enzyme